MQLDYAAQAVAEVDKVLACYRAIDPLLSERFVAAIDESIRPVCAMPTTWKCADDGLHQYRVRVFPPVVAYALQKDCTVVAFTNTHRRPNYWRARLAGPA